MLGEAGLEIPAQTALETTRKLPLDGVVVIDLTHIYNGPYATFLMAMAGATVIKIEPLAASTCGTGRNSVGPRLRSPC